MPKIAQYLILIFLICVSYTTFAKFNDNAEVRIIIKYHDKNPKIRKSLPKSFTSTFTLKDIESLAGDRYVLVFENPSLKHNMMRKENISNLLKVLRSDKSVKYAVLDRVGYFNPIIAPPTENYSKLPSHEMQWNEFSPPQGVMLESGAGLKDGAWQYTTGDSEKQVVIAVLDTGIALNANLLQNIVKNPSGKIWGWNFSQNNSDLTDETLSYHGTHVAGIIAAHGDYIQGMGDKLKILPIKIPARDGMFYESWVINALYWSVGGEVPGAPQNIHPAQVLNMSFGVDIGPGEELDICDEALQEAIDYVKSKNALIVVAAGNDNRLEHYNAPAVCNGTLKIAATGPQGHRAYYSNYGPGINFAAPGGDIRYGRFGAILSTVRPDSGYLNSGLDFYQGTSMAAPHVAGVAGLVIATNNQLDVHTIENLLTLTTHEFGHGASENYSCVGRKPCGNGILDANQAVKAAKANYDYLISTPFNNNDLSTYRPLWSQMAKNFSSYRPLPYIYKDKTGNIFAEIEDKLFRLKTENFSKCDIIGFNGIGCYN